MIEPTINPDEDGRTHINIYSKGGTELGRLLSNFAQMKLKESGKYAKNIGG